MRHRLLVALGCLLTLSASGAAGARRHGAPTHYGALEGFWSSASLTTLERPNAFTSLVISQAQAEAAMAKASQPPDGVGGPQSEDAFWDHDLTYARIHGQLRSSWIVAPRDGRLPYRQMVRRRLDAESPGLDGPEARPPSERCFSATAGPPMLNALQNNNYQIVETPDQVAILLENDHQVRIIRLRDKTHGPGAIRPWMGDSIGWWEGATLVVETTGFDPGQSRRQNLLADVYISSGARVTERFTRTSRNTILYQFAVEDPATYTRAWRGEMPLVASAGPIFEYACHEGNYAMSNILAGARAEERLKATRGPDAN